MESLSESKQPAVQGQGQVQGQKQPTLESHRRNPVRHDGFTAKGYHIYNLKVDINVTDFETLYTLSTKYKTSPIFNQEIQTDTTIDDTTIDKNKQFDNDNKRSASAPIQNKNNPVIVKTMSSVNQHAELINPKFKVQKAVYLCSEAGCLLQAEHTDGTPTTGVFCSCVLAIQDGTKIMMNGETIYLNVGEAIFFHPDVFHRGCDYVNANNRLFFYIAEEKKDIPSDGVGDLEPRYCDYCDDLLFYESEYDHQKKRSITNNHHNYCPIKNGKEKLDDKREKERISRKKRRAAAKVAKESEKKKAATSELQQGTSKNE
jgi:hypothetical protein